MADPNDTLAKIEMLCADVAKSKTRLGYDSDLMRRVGTFVFGSLGAVQEAIRAPDGKSWRSSMLAEASKRGELEAENKRLQDFIWSLDGKTIAIRGDGGTFIDDGVVVASDHCR